MKNVAPEKLLGKVRVLRLSLTAVLLLIAGGAVAQIGYLIADTQGYGRFLGNATGYPDQELRTWQIIALALTALGQTALWAGIAWQGRAVFGALEQGAVERAAQSASGVSKTLWATLVYSLIASTLAVLVVTWHFPEGQRAFAVSLGSAHVTTILAALIASFLSQALVLGAALWRDHQEVI